MSRSVTRYFMATCHGITVFRQSSTRVYVWANWASGMSKNDLNPPFAISFHTTLKPLQYGISCAEITKAHYNALVGLKYDRHHGAGLPGDAGSPQDSWVWNKDLPTGD